MSDFLPEIHALFESAVRSGFPIALWRLPYRNKINAVVGLMKQIAPSQLDIYPAESGFCLAPFINPGGTRSLFIRSDFTYNSDMRKLMENPGTEKDKPTRKMKDRFVDEFNSRVTYPQREPCLWHDVKAIPPTQNDEKKYRLLVEDAIKLIAECKFKKLVLSRTKVVRLDESFDAIKYFDKLCLEYPTAFVTLVSIPSVGTWMVATPETLVGIDKNKNLHTMALAGTQQAPADPSVDPESVWSQKERVEQGLVSQYIIECFKEIGLQGFISNGPYTVRAGHLLHLCTEFTVALDQQNSSLLGSRILNLLHPTSAVCGMPKEEAMAYICRYEKYDRQFYTGFLGPVNWEYETHLFVNLRCLQLYRKEATIYAGAGITVDSDPKREWLETETKCDTLLKVMSV